MKILLLNPNYIKRYNWGHQLFKNEFVRHHEVTYYGPDYVGYDKSLSVPEILKNLNIDFDLILTYEAKYSRFFKGLGNISHIPKAHIQIDYALNFDKYKGFADVKNINALITKNKPDIIFTTSGSNMEALRKNLNMKKVFLLPFSVDTNVYKNLGMVRAIDAMAVFSTRKDVYPRRSEIQRALNKMKIKSFTSRVIKKKYIEKLNQTKVFVISNNINKRLSMKYTESMACGAFVLADEPEDLSLQGFVSGKHLVLYKDVSDMQDKLNYYLKHNEERENIANTGMNFVREKHSCEKRVLQFTAIVKRELGI